MGRPVQPYQRNAAKGEQGMNPHEIIEIVAREENVPVKQIYGKGRMEPVVIARHRAMKACYEDGWSVTEISKVFNRDHTTVAYALSKTGAGNLERPGKPTPLEISIYDAKARDARFEDYPPAMPSKGSLPRVCRHYYPSEKTEYPGAQSSLRELF